MKYINLRRLISNKFEVICVWIFMLVFFLVSASLKSNFTTFYNINNLLILILPLMLIGIGQTLVVLTGGIDLSVGSVISVSNVVCATLMTQTTSGCLKAIIISLLAGVTIGMLNGLIITKTRIAPLIVTLAMSSIVILSSISFAFLNNRDRPVTYITEPVPNIKPVKL